MVGRLTDVLFVYVLREWSRMQPKDSKGWLTALHDPQLARAFVKVHEQPARQWTVEQLAEEAALSRAAFARRFKDLVGQTPLGYVTQWRMALAARMLADTALPISTVADRVGYTSEFAFNRAFSRERGEAPGHWRTRARPVLEAAG